jgi:hypothetical protein
MVYGLICFELDTHIPVARGKSDGTGIRRMCDTFSRLRGLHVSLLDLLIVVILHELHDSALEEIVRTMTCKVLGGKSRLVFQLIKNTLSISCFILPVIATEEVK